MPPTCTLGESGIGVILIIDGGTATTGIPSSTITGAEDEGVGGVSDGDGGVTVSVGAVGTAVAEEAGLAGWLPHPAIKAAASIRAPRERRISPPTSAVAPRLRGRADPSGRGYAAGPETQEPLV